MTGQNIAQFEILGQIGRGGMGEVFRARDTRLSRVVALKVLPKEFSQDLERLRRFEQEAKALAALNHANLLTIYEAGVHAGAPYLVSELLEGETLRQALDRSEGPLSPRRVTDYALQIAHGLAAAHSKNVIHRDLKPDNIFITSDGRVKILDFGLAKLLPTTGGLSSPTDSVGKSGEQRSGEPEAVTVVNPTEHGIVLGTPAYMAPEQVRGQGADQRADIFSFGAILYEMLSGRKVFRRDSSVETMNAILKDEPPDLLESNPNLPPLLERVARRCLEKAPERRFQSASDLVFALENLHGFTSTRLQPIPEQSSRWRWTRSLTVAGVCGLVLSAVFLAMHRRSAPQVGNEPLLRLSVATPPDAQILELALSPDGKYLAFAAIISNKASLIIRSLASDETRIVPETENAHHLFWAPDSSLIGLFDGGKIKAVPPTGGRAREIANARGGGATWNRRGVIVFAEFWRTGLFRTSAESGEVVPLFPLNKKEHEGAHLWPRFLPDGRYFLFLVRSVEPESSWMWIGDVTGGIKRRRLISADGLVGWVDPDQVVFARRGMLWTQTFDLKQLAFVGTPRVLSEAVACLSADSMAIATCSRAGMVAYKTIAAPVRQLTWLDRQGQSVGTVGAPGMVRSFRLAPGSEKSVAVSRLDRQSGSYFLWEIETVSGAELLLSRRRNSESPVWSPTGAEIAYQSDELTMFNLYRWRSGLEPDQQLLYPTAIEDKEPTDWSPDGKYLLFQQYSNTNSWDIWTLVLDDPAHPRPLVATEATEVKARFSPDGTSIAYSSDESGRDQVYVQSFPKAGSRIAVSRSGGRNPVWSPNGKELFFLDLEGALMSAPMGRDEAGGLKAGVPKILFPIPAGARTSVESYSVSSDGQRFLLALDVPSANAENVTFLLHALGHSAAR